MAFLHLCHVVHMLEAFHRIDPHSWNAFCGVQIYVIRMNGHRKSCLWPMSGQSYVFSLLYLRYYAAALRI